VEFGDDAVTLFQAIVLGLVQGLTEFLPISSTAHLRVVPALLGFDDAGAAFSAVIQLGTVAAVLVYFRRDIVTMSQAWFESVLARQPFLSLESKLAWLVLGGTIPIGLLGLLLKKTIETQFRSLPVIAWALILLGIILGVVEAVARKRRPLEDITLLDGAVVGLAQATALVPGASRSGTTITAGLALGFTRQAAARFSFLLSIPSTALAGLFELKHLVSAVDAPPLALLLVATAVSFGAGLVAIDSLLKFVKTNSMLPFVLYRVALGAFLLWRF
jgi:undecaprenyl-diphosphatase